MAAGPGDASIKTATLKELWDNFPREGKSSLFKKMGGQIPEIAAELEDDSALRISKAVIDSGHVLTASTMHSGKSIVDGDHNTVIASVDEFKIYLQRRFGKPKHMKNQEAAMGRTGIVCFENITGKKGASHLDLWDGKTTATIDDHWTDCESIWLWELPAC